MNLPPIRVAGLLGIVVLVGICLFGGCASQTDLVASGRVTLEPRIDRALRSPPDVHEDEGDLVVSGRLDRGLPKDLGGHLDVTVVAPDGTTVYDAQVNYRADTASVAGTPQPRHGSSRGARTRYGNYRVYSVRFPGLPPDGSVVRVRHDPDTHPASEPKP